MSTRRYGEKINKTGYIYILLTFLIGVGAVNTGNNLLYLVASLMLSLLILSGIGSVWNLLFLDVCLTPPAEIYAHIPALFNLIISRKKGRSYFLECETPFGSTQLPIVKDRIEVPFWLTFSERGKIEIKNLKIQSGFPLGFFNRFRVFSPKIEILVYPKPLFRSLPLLSGASRGGEKLSLSQGELSDEPSGLRDYRESDPLKWVEWKASARRGTMMVREFYYLEGDVLMINLKSNTQLREQQLSEACYLVLEGAKRRLAIGLSLPEKDISARKGNEQKLVLLETLAHA